MVVSRQRPALTRPCFNGAATLSLRKFKRLGNDARDSLKASMGPQLYRCGNTHCRIFCRRYLLASMGPQLYRCGNSHSFSVILRHMAVLQWGRNFIVAEILAAPPLLSWRHVRFNGAATLSLRKSMVYYGSINGTTSFNGAATLSLRKSIRRLLALVAALAASMGPQLYRCGNWRFKLQTVTRHLASMGPQLYRCGNRGRFHQGADIKNRFNGAATLSLRK